MKFAFTLFLALVGYTFASRDSSGSRSGSGSPSGTGGDRWGSGSGRGSGTGDTWGSGSRGTGDRGTGTGGSLRGSGGQCQWVRGHVKCADSAGKHDKNHVVVRLADSSLSTGTTLDEGYTSQNGQFAVFGCSGSSSFRTFKPELQVLHFCKSNRARKLRIPVPEHHLGSEYNITAVIDLKAYYPEEQDYQDNIQLPCAV